MESVKTEHNIVYLTLDEIKPYDNNPRNNTEAVKQVKKSLRDFGFQNPIIVDKDMVIICGHTRYEAAKELKLESVPVIIADELTDQQVKAFRLVDNKTAEYAEWDYDKLMEEIANITDFDMGEYEFNLIEEEDDLEKIVEDTPPDPELEEEAISKPGDIYILGNHRLMCGDSTKAADVEKLMDGAIADLIVTDPPYNVNIENSKGMKIENDDMSSAAFKEFLINAFTNLNNFLKPGGSFYIWFASREHVNFETALNEAGLEVRQELIWNKNSLILGRKDYQWKHEPCLYGWKDGASHYFIDDRTQTTIIEDKKPDIKKMKKEEMQKLLEEIYSDKISTTIINEDRPSVNDLHPTMKPLKLLARLIKNSSQSTKAGSNTNNIVLDLFGGSGSTLIACEQLDRKCYMMEYDPHYADVIVKRWEDFTGRKAIKI